VDAVHQAARTGHHRDVVCLTYPEIPNVSRHAGCSFLAEWTGWTTRQKISIVVRCARYAVSDQSLLTLLCTGYFFSAGGSDFKCALNPFQLKYQSHDSCLWVGSLFLDRLASLLWSYFRYATVTLQESHAIAKVTAQYAVYMYALDNFESPWLHQWLLFPKLLTGFCCDGLYESAYEIRSW